MLRKWFSQLASNPAPTPSPAAASDLGHLVAPVAIWHDKASHEPADALVKLAPELELRKKIYASLDNQSLKALRLVARGMADETRATMLSRKYPMAMDVKPPDMPIGVYIKNLRHVDAIASQWPHTLWEDSYAQLGPDTQAVEMAIEKGEALQMLRRCEKYERKPASMHLLKNLAMLRAHLGRDEEALRGYAKMLAARPGASYWQKAYQEPAALYIAAWAGQKGHLVKQAQYLLYAMQASHSACGTQGIHPVERNEEGWLRDLIAATSDEGATPRLVAALGVIAMRYGEHAPQKCQARWQQACTAYAALEKENRPLGLCILHAVGAALQKRVPASATALLQEA